MDTFKEFQARGLDQAIMDACEYFAVPREQLEIEIIQDAKSGIFGIVGARKAKIRARRAHVQETVEQLLGRSDAGLVLNDARSRQRRRKNSRQTQTGDIAQDRPDAADCRRQPENIGQSCTKPEKRQPENIHSRASEDATAYPCVAEPETDTEKSRDIASARPGPQPDAEADLRPDLDSDDVEASESWPQTPVEDLDQEALLAVTRDVVKRLIVPIAGESVRVEVDIDGARIMASIHDVQDSGLLIGREGQTLTAIQYLASRMISKAMSAVLRIKLDAGEYRQKQDEKVREMALLLAQKALRTGRSYSTRPLSSYHRRLVHLSLQDMPEIQTRSAGEGTLKRVVIMRRKADRPQ